MPDKHIRKTVIITGGSRGIGKSLVLEAALHGYNVCFSYLNNEAAAHEVVEQGRNYGVNICSLRADVSNASDVKKLFLAAENLGYPLQALINNAAIAGERKFLEAMLPNEWEEVFKVNVFGTLLCSQEAIKKMNKGGVILNMSSQAAVFGGNMLTPYAASKAAINTITIALSREAAPRGIRVNALSPGVIETDQNLFMDPQKRIDIINSIPLGRLGSPRDVAKVAMWILSEESSYITGTIIPVAGGR